MMTRQRGERKYDDAQERREEIRRQDREERGNTMTRQRGERKYNDKRERREEIG